MSLPEPLLDFRELLHGPPNTPVSLSIIWLHGFAANMEDLIPIIPQLNLPDDVAVRNIFPNAPLVDIPLGAKKTTYAWFNILRPSFTDGIDFQGINKSVQRITRFVEREMRHGIPSNRIILAGFSQGGVIAAHLALAYPKKLAGLLALSTFFPIDNKFRFSAENKNTPILIQHGSNDEIISPIESDKFKATLIYNGFKRWEVDEYEMGHVVSPPEIKRIGEWIIERINEQANS